MNAPDLFALAPFAPLAGAAVLALGAQRLAPGAVAWIGCGSVGLAALLVFVAGTALLDAGGGARTVVLGQWIAAGDLEVVAGFLFDGLSLSLAAVVAGVGFLIHVYATRYMQGDPAYGRFFAVMNLFLAAMLVLVLADDLLLLYLGWEGVGLCSYLLIGFHHAVPANADAARKAFVITRIGDTALAIALLLLFREFGTLQIDAILASAPAAWPVGSTLATVVALLLLGGAVGKSAQLPLQTWLPDAMAGPTPVSALIHAATMVTAGVYLIARLHGLFLLAPDAQFAVAVIGAATLLLAAAAALVQTDLKRILAYSTMSQIGYMFLALGVGAWSAAIFHLVTHAFFKALLFLAAGSVILALHHEQDVRRMGGLRRVLPVPFAAMVVGAAALAALPPTAGFASKDPILLAAFEHGRAGPLLWAVGVAGAVLTAVYATRMVAVVFFGERRSEATSADTPATVVPLVLLLLAALGGGWFGFDATAAVLPDGGLGASHGPGAVAVVTVAAPLLAVVATVFAWRRSRPAATEPGGGLRGLLRSGGGFDALYARLLERPFLRLAEAARDDWIDRPFAWVATSARRLHELFVQTQNGALRAYATVLALGLAALLLLATGAG